MSNNAFSAFASQLANSPHVLDVGESFGGYASEVYGLWGQVSNDDEVLARPRREEIESLFGPQPEEEVFEMARLPARFRRTRKSHAWRRQR